MSDTEIFFSAANLLVVSITAAIIWWYTRETNKLRKTTQEQTRILTDQVNLMREEFKLAIEKQQFEREKETRALDPLIEFAGGNRNRRDETARMKFENQGSTVKNLVVESEGDFAVQVTPSHTLSEGKQGYFEFRNLPADMEEGTFVLHYENLAGQKRSKRYKFISGSFVEVTNKDGT